MPVPPHRGLEVGDTVRVLWDAKVIPVEGVLQQLPSVQTPYWVVSHAGPLKSNVFAFTGTVAVYRLPTTE